MKPRNGLGSASSVSLCSVFQWSIDIESSWSSLLIVETARFRHLEYFLMSEVSRE